MAFAGRCSDPFRVPEPAARPSTPPGRVPRFRRQCQSLLARLRVHDHHPQHPDRGVRPGRQHSRVGRVERVCGSDRLSEIAVRFGDVSCDEMAMR